MKELVFLAELFHQTNTFAGGIIRTDEFVIRGGQDMLDIQGELSPISGVLEVSENEGWDLRPVISVKAPSGPVVSDMVVDFFWRNFRTAAEAVASTGVGGVFVMFHGAMVSESQDDVEGEILRRIRGMPGFSDIPICGVLDLHANFTDAMARQADGLIACRGSSETDAKEAARDAAILLDNLMKLESRPTTIREHPPILWPPAVAATDREPMISLQSRARTLEHEIPDVSFINVFAGFPYSDVPEAGVSFTAIADGDLIEVTGDGEPLNMRGELISKSVEHELNSYAMVKVRGVTVLLIGARTPMDSFECLRAFEVEPEDYSVIVLKSSKELKPSDDPQPFTTLVLDSPGPTSLRLGCLPFRKVTRTVYPLDAL